MANKGRAGAGSPWLVVAGLGVVVLVLVVALGLFGRLDAGQQVVDGLRPAMTEANVATTRSGVEFLSTVIDTIDPLVFSTGAAAELAPFLGLVATSTGQTQEEVFGTLREQFPHVAGIVDALPLEAVTDEIGRLVPFLATALALTPEQAAAALGRFPRLTQAITSLPTVTSGWIDVPGTPGARFDGSPVDTVRQVRDYFRADAVPIFERHADEFRAVDRLPGGVKSIAPLLTVLGFVAAFFGAAMWYLDHNGMLNRALSSAAWGAVLLVSVLVLVLVVAFQLFGRLGDAQELADGAEPAFSAERVDTSRGGIEVISAGVDTLDPIVSALGGAAAEVPLLIDFLAETTGLPTDGVRGLLAAEFPRVTALLDALPLEAVTAEIAPLVSFLSTALNRPGDQVIEILTERFPKLGQAIGGLPQLTGSWASVPGTDGTRFDGAPIDTATQVRDYFRLDLVTAVEDEQANFRKLAGGWPPADYLAPVLTVTALAMGVFAGFYLVVTRRSASG
ncbi:MAG: hypothetical protein ACT4PW_06780 [Acidimicrobiia bacterium]